MIVWGLESERHSAGDCLITVVGYVGRKGRARNEALEPKGLSDGKP
jgi:hypothetical protein